jgi:predicted AAA+ superfamily ATPase
MRKIYFCDTGIRNALINNFNPLHIRQDAGALFENFMIMERVKKNSNAAERLNQYFWRTHQQQELDYLEERGGKIKGFEFKYSRTPYKAPALFLETYKESTVELIHKENCIDFVM